MAHTRAFKQGELHRGRDETYAYTFSLSPLPAGTYSVPACKLLNAAGTDVSATVLTGSASVAGGVFTTPKFVANVAARARHKLLWSVKIDGETWSGFADILFED